MSFAPMEFPGLPNLVEKIRGDLVQKRFVVLYAYNGTGKTRLSVAFKDFGKQIVHDLLTSESSESVIAENGEAIEGSVLQPDTLYFNAFTEDLFSWDNDLQHDRERVLRLNRDSRFFAGLVELEMETRIRPLLNRYADFDFHMDTTNWEVSFSREVEINGVQALVEDIKVSRGEENIFIWCFFLAIVQLALDGAEAYKWVKFLYIDDPISSLDDNNAVMVAHHLAQMLSDSSSQVRTVISTHHVLFFNVLCNELKKSRKYFLSRKSSSGNYLVSETDSTPFLHHLSSLVDLHEAVQTGALYTHHFNILRRVMEQTASFFGYSKWDECIKPDPEDRSQALYKRVIDLMSHGDYSIYEPREMMPENKEHFSRALKQFIRSHPFSPSLFGGAS